MSETSLPADQHSASPNPVRSDPDGPAHSRVAALAVRTLAVRTLAVLLGLFYAVASGVPKLIADPSATESFARIGWGDWFMYLIGTLELLGGIALLIPLLSGVAAVAFIGLMAGAGVMSLVYLDGEFWFTPVLLIVPLVLIARTQRRRTLRLFRLLRGRRSGA